MTARLQAHVEIAAILKLAASLGGFATVLAKGEQDAGTILLVTMSRGKSARLFERMPQLDGTRSFVLTKEQDVDDTGEFSEYLVRRSRQDPDTWIVEVDVEPEIQFVELLQN